MSTKTEKKAPPPDKLAIYDKLIATNSEIERKGVGLPYTSCNGNMFSFLAESGAVGLRLGKAERAAFLQKYNTTLFATHGTVMKEYVTVPDDLLQRTEELKHYFELSYAYVKTLKPKAAMKSKPA
jgi:TfoX/Sxy family transcriptional regulator of competence genes